jgi:hypothetical protein
LFDFITALTKKQIEKLIEENVFQLSLFDEELSEAILDDGIYFEMQSDTSR